MKHTEEAVLNAIRNSMPRAITREELTWLTGLTDRHVRSIIQKLRHHDNWIISCPSTPGYRLTGDSREWDRFVTHWNQGNRFNMLKKSKENERQTQITREWFDEAMFKYGRGE